MGQKIPAFIPKPKTESTELFFSGGSELSWVGT